MFHLKDYQQRALDSLKHYFAECVKSGDANTAFYYSTLQSYGTGIPYNPVKELEQLPYICIRIPTGGGKTLVACYSVGVASKTLLQAEQSLVLWLVPSNAIRSQTVEALKNRQHPYRLALESSVGSITVMDVEDALYLNRTDLDTSTTIIVSTMQSFRVDDTLGRRVYRDSGSLMDHFSGLSSEMVSRLEKGAGGNILHSLANVLCVRRPIIIVDEAHNARTGLSFETLTRFNPSCILEFTATPARENNPSNVLHTVSAAELKSEGMIKIPIRLETRPDWKELLSDAIACRSKLESLAGIEQKETGEYIRPIMLIQAQPHRKNQETIAVEVVKDCLIQDFQIPEDQIAMATGAKNELDKVEDISVENCAIRYVITQQALREGWDCPFAYVLCSVAEIKSTTYVEQILGRIMRLPSVSWKKREELNMAYAFVASSRFFDAANSLTDALVQNGFEKQEAKELIIQAPNYQDELHFDEYKPFLGTVFVDSPEQPDLSGLPEPLIKKVSYDQEEKKVAFRGIMVKEEVEELKSCFSTDEGKAVAEIVYKRSNGFAEDKAGTPSEQGILFSIPILAVKQGDLFEPFEETHFLDHPWELSACDGQLPKEEYSFDRSDAQQGEIEVTDKGEVKAKFIESLQQEMEFFSTETDWKEADLIYWLDRNIPHRDLNHNETGAFINKVVQMLMEQRGIQLHQLVRDKFRLKEAVANLINKHREQAHNRTYQALLLPECETPVEVTPELCFSYNPRQYPYNTLYKGRYEFKKHYYPEIGDLKGEGEEFQCAQYIDQLEEVEFWVRNLERRPSHSFWLQTATDKFYPDFVCKLKDGRFLVVEYKGEHLWNEDSKEKNALGELWEKRSGKSCIFHMCIGKNFSSIKNKICSNQKNY